MFTADGNLEDQNHLKYVILKIKIRSPKQRDLEDQDHAHLSLSNTTDGIALGSLKPPRHVKVAIHSGGGCTNVSSKNC